MRKSRLSKQKQDRLIEHFVAGTTAKMAAALVNVNFKTAGFFCHCLREIIVIVIENETPFSGEIEVDESYFGGARKGKRGAELSEKCLPGRSHLFWASKARR